MPRLLCAWALSREAQKDLRNFCVPELEAALELLQATPADVHVWKLAEAGGGAAHADKAAYLPSQEKARCQESDEASPDVHGKTKSSSSVQIVWAQFEHELVAREAARRCVLLTAIIEVC